MLIVFVLGFQFVGGLLGHNILFYTLPTLLHCFHFLCWALLIKILLLYHLGEFTPKYFKVRLLWVTVVDLVAGTMYNKHNQPTISSACFCIVWLTVSYVVFFCAHCIEIASIWGNTLPLLNKEVLDRFNKSVHLLYVHSLLYYQY